MAPNGARAQPIRLIAQNAVIASVGAGSATTLHITPRVGLLPRGDSP
jgi:hypothetical protein